MKLSVIIITFNEEKMIGDCIKSIGNLADEIIVIDDYSQDQTMRILKQVQNDNKKLKIFQRRLNNDFATQRNFALQKATGEWILYVDADERVTPELKKEILKQVQNDPSASSGQAGYFLKRKNFYFGNHEWPKIEKLERLFKKEKLKEWFGKVHESPKIFGDIDELGGFLLHYTHRDLSSMLAKTIEWSKTEARLRFDNHHPKMAVWRFPKVMLKAFWNSYITQGGWRVGVAGLIESMFQAFSAFITYARLWELQNETK